MTMIWYNSDDDRIVIEGALQTYAPRTLMTVVAGDTIMVRLKVNSRNEFGPASYTTITDVSGKGFPDVGSAVSYLNAMFAWKPPVGEKFGVPAVAGTNLVQGQPVAVSRVSGQLFPARADSYVLSFVAGLASADTAKGFVNQPAHGAVTLSDWTAQTGSPSLSVGQPYFLDRSGGLTTTPDFSVACVARIGVAAAPFTLVVDPSAPVLL